MRLPSLRPTAAFVAMALVAGISLPLGAEERRLDATHAKEAKSTHRLPVILEKDEASRLESLAVIEDGEHERPVLSAISAVSPHHLVLMLDLESSKPADRFRAMAPLQEFLLGRVAAGDQVTVTLWPGSGGEIEILCSTFRDPGVLATCLDELRRRKSAAHQAARQRGEEPAKRIEEAHLALAKAIDLTAGTGLRTHVLYLGTDQGLTPGAGRTFSSTATVGGGGGDGGPAHVVGSVQYLVSLPRSGPLQSLGRHATDQLLASALGAEAAVYPLQNGLPALGQDARLADETGGRALDLRHLSHELASLGGEIDRTIELVFERPETDSRFHRVSIRGVDGRWPNGFYASAPGERLESRARAAALLGARREARGLAGSLGGPIAEGDTWRGVLSLSFEAPIADSESVTLQLAVAMEDGRLLQRSKTFGISQGQIRLPLRFEAGTRALGIAARLGRRDEIAMMSWPIGNAGP